MTQIALESEIERLGQEEKYRSLTQVGHMGSRFFKFIETVKKCQIGSRHAPTRLENPKNSHYLGFSWGTTEYTPPLYC